MTNVRARRDSFEKGQDVRDRTRNSAGNLGCFCASSGNEWFLPSFCGKPRLAMAWGNSLLFTWHIPIRWPFSRFHAERELALTLTHPPIRRRPDCGSFFTNLNGAQIPCSPQERKTEAFFQTDGKEAF